MTSQAHRNNFNLLRLIMACAVVYSHSFALLGLEEPVLWGRTLGSLSVHGFFVISGYLICQSYLRTSSLLAFTWRRVLRIVPGLVVAIAFTKALAALCGGFAANPVAYIANGPVWTLTWEAVCYAGLAALGLIGVLNRYSLPAVFASAWLLYLANMGSVSEAFAVIAPLAMMFLTGAFIFVMESTIHAEKSMGASVAGLVLITSPYIFSVVSATVRGLVPFLWGPPINDLQFMHLIYMAAFPFFVIYLGKDLRWVFEMKNDVSYGVYVFGWPLAQALIFTATALGFVWTQAGFFVATMLILLPLGYLSWRLVEKPAMRIKGLRLGAAPVAG